MNIKQFSKIDAGSTLYNAQCCTIVSLKKFVTVCGLMTALTSCSDVNTVHTKNEGSANRKQQMHQNMIQLDSTLTQNIQDQAKQLLLDSSTVWYTGLFHAMQSESWHLPEQQMSKGTYKSVSVDGVTYIIMSYNEYTKYPYGTNAIVSSSANQSQVVLNSKRIQSLCTSLGLHNEQQKVIMESIWLQEIYENKQTVEQDLPIETANFLGEVVSLLHGGGDYMLFRLHTLNKPSLLLSQLHGKNIITVTDHGGYTLAEEFYRQGMIRYLQYNKVYDSFIQEVSQDTQENNNYLIQKYFSDTKSLVGSVLGEQ